MTITDELLVLEQTKKWLNDVVIGCNFCPFAAREFKRETIFFKVLLEADRELVLQTLSFEFDRLNNNKNIETTLIILPNSFADFQEYLDLVELAENFLETQDYEGIYQIASFHPDYLFAGSDDSDPANYTNRSVYPMLHILREDSVSLALESYTHPENIPVKNIEYSNQKGLAYMKALRDACYKAL